MLHGGHHPGAGHHSGVGPVPPADRRSLHHRRFRPRLSGDGRQRLLLFSLTYITRWFSFATQSFLSAIEKPVAASAISVCTALVFPVILIGVFWPLGLDRPVLNFAGTAVLAGILALILLLRQKELWKKDGTESA